MVDERYIRQIAVPQVGMEGQSRLQSARVLVVGSGGLGSPILYYLAAAGVGKVGVVDGDAVGLSNLNRQILYTNNDIGESKALVAARRLSALNPEIEVVPYVTRVMAENGPTLVSGYDVVVEASDNLATKDLMNTLCVQAGRPLVWGAVERFEGQMGVYMPGHTCRHCIFPVLPEPGTYPPPDIQGIVGATAGVIGTLQALEAIKIILGVGKLMVDKVLLWDGLSQSFDFIAVQPDPSCSICSSDVADKH